jgi:arylsulfatase A-like enzyme
MGYVAAHAKAKKPFLLVVSFGAPHFPHDSAPPEYRALYPPDKIQLPPNVPEGMKQRARQEASGYYAHCTALDKCVGDLMSTLTDTGIADNTILIFTSDHGEMMGSQGRRPRIKQVPWDESAHVPFLLRFPAASGPEGRDIPEPITTPDILPTLLSLVGVPIPKTVEGREFASLVRGQRAPANRAALYMNVSPFDPAADIPEYRAIRTARYTYARSLQGPWLLYDDQADPHQMTNLVSNAEATRLKRQLDDQLNAELKRIGDQFKPRQFYLEKFGYKLVQGAIPYSAGPPPTGVQSPAQPP